MTLNRYHVTPGHGDCRGCYVIACSHACAVELAVAAGELGAHERATVDVEGASPSWPKPCCAFCEAR